MPMICFEQTKSPRPWLPRKVMVYLGVIAILAGSAIATPSMGNEMATLTDDFWETFSYRQDFCSRYHEMAKEGDDLSIKNALSGSELRVHLWIDNEFRYNESTGIDPEYPGITAVVLDYIAEKANFTWRNSFAASPLGVIGGNYTDTLKWGVLKYDVMVGKNSPSPERMSLGIDFTEGIYDGSLIMTRLKEFEEAKIEWFSYLRPFEPAVWYTILAVIVFSSICHCFIEVLGGKYDSDASFRTWGMGNLYMGFINATGNYSYEPKSLGGLVFGVFFAFWALLLTAAYTANLASFYVLSHVVEQPVVDLQDALDQGLPICVPKGVYAAEYLCHKYPDHPFIFIDREEFDWEWYKVLDRDECELSVVAKFELGLVQANAKANPSCALEWQGKMIQHKMDGFSTKLDLASNCPDIVNLVLSHYIMEMKEEGVLEELWKEHYEFYGTEGHCEEGNDGSHHRRLEASERKRSSQNRYLKSISKGGAAGGATASHSISYRGTEDDERMSMKEMAGTMAFQVGGCLIAILLAIVGKLEGKVSGRKSRKRRQTVTTSQLSERELSTEFMVLTQTIRSMEQSLVELKQDFERTRYAPFSAANFINRDKHRVPSGQSLPQQQAIGLRDSWTSHSSGSIVFESEDTDSCINNTMGFHSDLSTEGNDRIASVACRNE